jgi:hypothetical protein
MIEYPVLINLPNYLENPDNFDDEVDRCYDTQHNLILLL